jgi:hypothetical protein
MNLRIRNSFEASVGPNKTSLQHQHLEIKMQHRPLLWTINIEQIKCHLFELSKIL